MKIYVGKGMGKHFNVVHRRNGTCAFDMNDTVGFRSISVDLTVEQAESIVDVLNEFIEGEKKVTVSLTGPKSKIDALIKANPDLTQSELEW